MISMPSSEAVNVAKATHYPSHTDENSHKRRENHRAYTATRPKISRDEEATQRYMNIIVNIIRNVNS